MASVRDIYRYPVKGLSGERLSVGTLQPGKGLPWDRAFALAHGTAPFDPAAPQWLPKTHFLTLMQNERLAQLDCQFETESETLILRRDGKQLARGKLTTPSGRAIIEQFFAAFMKDEVRGSPKVVSAEGHRFFDSRSGFLSVIGLGSISDLERVVRRPVHPLRFRANVYLNDTLPWEEFTWVGRELSLGQARVRILKRIDRCPATNVDPENGQRDMRIPRTLQDNFGHQDLGVYAEVIAAGEIRPGDQLKLSAT